MRVLGKNLKNEYEILDPVSGSKIILYYRIPKPSEVVEYYTSVYKKHESPDLDDARIDSALKIITGFPSNTFADENGNEITASIENEAEWKGLLKQGASDLLNFFAVKIFEGYLYIQPVNGEAEKKILPLKKSSGDGQTGALLNEEKPAN